MTESANDILSQIDNFPDRPDNWDGYGAPGCTVTPIARDVAKSLVEKLSKDLPTRIGYALSNGISLSWIDDNRWFTIDIDGKGKLLACWTSQELDTDRLRKLLEI